MKKSMLKSKPVKTAKVLETFTRDWQLLIDTLPYAVFMTDIECNVILANRQAHHLSGADIDCGKTKCFQAFHNAEGPIDMCPFSRVLESGTIEQIEVYEPRIARHLSITAAPAIDNGTVVGIMHTVIDITEQKDSAQSSEDLIDVYAESINSMKSREIRAKKGRDAFLNMLEDINESYKELEDLFLRLVLVMVNALDAKSPWTKGHSERVSMYAEEIAKKLVMDDEDVKEIRLAGLLHDIGKIGTYDYLLDKPGRLTREEFEIVKKHPEQGAAILKDIKQLRAVIPFIHYHHEKLDGNGYPMKLKGDEIPLGARILHVADSFDSMTSDRPYRPAPGIEYALSELHKFKGTQFDHDVVDAFLKVLEESGSWGPALPSEGP